MMTDRTHFIELQDPRELKKALMTNVFLEQPIFITQSRSQNGTESFVILDKKVYLLTDFLSLVCVFSEGSDFLRVFDKKQKRPEFTKRLFGFSFSEKQENHKENYCDHPFVKNYKDFADRLKYIWKQVDIEEERPLLLKDFYKKLFREFDRIQTPEGYRQYCCDNKWLGLVKYIETLTYEIE